MTILHRARSGPSTSGSTASAGTTSSEPSAPGGRNCKRATASPRPWSCWESLHHLVRILNRGEESASEVVARLGAMAEPARELAYRLYRNLRPDEPAPGGARLQRPHPELAGTRQPRPPASSGPAGHTAGAGRGGVAKTLVPCGRRRVRIESPTAAVSHSVGEGHGGRSRRRSPSRLTRHPPRARPPARALRRVRCLSRGASRGWSRPSSQTRKSRRLVRCARLEIGGIALGREGPVLGRAKRGGVCDHVPRWHSGLGDDAPDSRASPSRRGPKSASGFPARCR